MKFDGNNIFYFEIKLDSSFTKALYYPFHNRVFICFKLV